MLWQAITLDLQKGHLGVGSYTACCIRVFWGGTDYVVSVYPPPPRIIHPPHRIPRILEESVIVLRRLRIHYNNIVSLLHGIVQSLP